MNARTKLTFAVLAAALLAVLAAAGASAAAEPAPPPLTLSASPSIVSWGKTASLDAHIGVPGAALTLSRKYPTEAQYTVVATATADVAGNASWRARTGVTTVYRVDFAGDGAWAPASAECTLNVRPRLTLRVTAVEPVLVGRRITFGVTVWPAHPAGTVMLQGWGKEGWGSLAEATLGDDSSATLAWRADAHGLLAVRASMAADADHAFGRSTVWKTIVIDPRNPYNVPSSYPHLILVDLSKYKLYYHERGQVVRVFDCVLGRPGLPTPRGHFRIYAKDSGVGGPYGPRRMRYLGNYAIHGTNEPWLLSRYPRNFSHGCTRLANANILWLYDRVHVGTPVWNVP